MTEQEQCKFCSFSNLIEEIDDQQQEGHVKVYKNIYRGTIQVKSDDQAGVFILQLPDKIQFMIWSWYPFDHYWSTGINVRFGPVCGRKLDND
jgi:hypothetical protein